MITINKIYISKEQPVVVSGLWLKPEGEHYKLYLIDGVNKKEIKFSEESISTDVVVKGVIGSVKDEKTANTINGAKAYAKEVKKAVTGSISDTPEDMTLYGLKAYVDSKISK